MNDPDLSLLTVGDLRRLRQEAQEILNTVLTSLANLPEYAWPAAQMIYIRQLRINIERYDVEIKARLAPRGAPSKLFFSYSHKDEDLRNELAVHLAVLRREGSLSEWHDREISPGENWKNVLDANLESANIILLLVSADFIASDYCYQIEMRRALERNSEGAVVIPVILRDCDWKSTPFATLQALPHDLKPVIAWQNRDEAWADVVRGIRSVLNARFQRQPNPA
jgi:hypothetical protein